MSTLTTATSTRPGKELSGAVPMSRLLHTASIPLSAHETEAADWGRLAVAALIWVVLPMTIGWFRLLHRELKSA